MRRLGDLVLWAVAGNVCAGGILMPVLVSDVVTALLAWLVALVLVITFRDAVERSDPGATSALWSIQMRMAAMGIQVGLDACYRHLGDAAIVVGYLIMLTRTVRLGAFPRARVVGPRRLQIAFPRARTVLGMAIFTLPGIDIFYGLIVECLP